MVRTIASAILALLLIFGISVVETSFVKKTFETFDKSLTELYKKAEDGNATYADGNAVRVFWRDKKRVLHILIPHTSIETVDYQLNEALGYLYEGKYDDALPKIEVLIEIAKKIPRAYSFRLENVF